MIKNTDLEFILCKTAEPMKAGGLMANSTVSALLSLLMPKLA